MGEKKEVKTMGRSEMVAKVKGSVIIKKLDRAGNHKYIVLDSRGKNVGETDRFSKAMEMVCV